MKYRIPARALAALIAILFASMPTRPAAAAVDPGTVITGIKTAYDLISKYTNHQLTLEQATAQVVSAIGAAKTEILARIDGLAAAQGKACTKSAIIAFQDIQILSQTSKEQLAKDGLDCLTLMEAYLEEIEDKASVDKLGFALNALGPILMMTRANAGLPQTFAISDAIQNGNYAVIAKLLPRCQTFTLTGDSQGNFTEQNIKCTAYNGDTGWAFSWVGDPNQPQERIQAQNKATRNTSRAVAQAVNPIVPTP